MRSKKYAAMNSAELEKEIVRLSKRIEELSSDIEILKKLKIANESIAQGKGEPTNG